MSSYLFNFLEKCLFWFSNTNMLLMFLWCFVLFFKWWFSAPCGLVVIFFNYILFKSSDIFFNYYKECFDLRMMFSYISYTKFFSYCYPFFYFYPIFFISENIKRPGLISPKSSELIFLENSGFCLIRDYSAK